MKSETHETPTLIDAWANALPPSTDKPCTTFTTTIKDDNGNEVARGLGSTSEESQQVASEKVRSR